MSLCVRVCVRAQSTCGTPRCPHMARLSLPPPYLPASPQEARCMLGWALTRRTTPWPTMARREASTALKVLYTNPPILNSAAPSKYPIPIPYPKQDCTTIKVPYPNPLPSHPSPPIPDDGVVSRYPIPTPPVHNSTAQSVLVKGRLRILFFLLPEATADMDS